MLAARLDVASLSKLGCVSRRLQRLVNEGASSERLWQGMYLKHWPNTATGSSSIPPFSQNLRICSSCKRSFKFMYEFSSWSLR